jgi:flagellar protein FliO/FliZ
LGGEELRLSIYALILTIAGLLIQLPSISAQEVPAQESSEQEFSSVEERLRAAERAFVLDEGAAGTVQATGPSIWAAIRMLLILTLAAVAIYGVVFLIKRSSRQTVVNDPFLKVLASSHLGSNRYAHVVSVGSKAWLLGSSDGGVNLIGEIDDKDIVNAMLLEDSRKSEEAPGRFPDFLSMLRRLGASVETKSSGADDIRKRRERLKGM